jgi:8-oxo-dGTP pyrophosphatase MutT (NUDIX family)
MVNGFPRKSACMIIVEPLTFKVLLIKRKPSLSFGGQYAFPGGTVDPSDIVLCNQNDPIHTPFFLSQLKEQEIDVALLNTTRLREEMQLHRITALR